MAFEFRLVECLLVFVLILCIFPDNIAKQQAKKKPFQSLKGILPFIKKNERPMYHNRLLDWNLTSQLSAARYMLNMYENINTEDNSPGFNVSNFTSTKQVQGADTIMGILNDDTTAKSSNYRMRLKFNFTAKIKSGDSVEAAEFHMYKGEPAYAWMRNASFVVELFVITIPGTSTTPTNLRKKLGTRVMQGWETGWEVFDITSAVDMWIISPLNNYGLEVTVKLLRTGYSIPAAPGKFGLVGFTGPLGQRPFIVSFFKGDPTDKGLVVHASSRKKRSLFNPAKLKFGNTASSTECKKRRLYVDFQELRWQNWIIAPDGYESSYCAGECNYAMYAPRNATNHAIVQTLVNLLNPDSAPSPCCAPTKLKAISVLFYDENKNVVLKKFQDMVVMSCGCR